MNLPCLPIAEASILSRVRLSATSRSCLKTGFSTYSLNIPPGLSINENADPDVQTDMDAIFNRLVKEREPYYMHTLEGDDDMPAHAKATLVGSSLTIPITRGKLNMGTWQGIYLCEFRNRGGGRRLVATIIS